jgi:hypothetical protein
VPVVAAVEAEEVVEVVEVVGEVEQRPAVAASVARYRDRATAVSGVPSEPESTRRRKWAGRPDA